MANVKIPGLWAAPAKVGRPFGGQGSSLPKSKKLPQGRAGRDWWCETLWLVFKPFIYEARQSSLVLDGFLLTQLL